MKHLGAVIVTYNSERVIGLCLDALLQHVGDVLVVDNGSSDRTRLEVESRPSVRWLENPTNRSFASAANLGICELDTPFVLLLNPDAFLLTGVEPLVEACRQPGVAVAAGKLVDDVGRPQVGFSLRRFPTPVSLSFEVLGLNRLWQGNPVNRRYRCRNLDHDIPTEVEQPAGAFLLLRRDAWESLGGFDEGFRPLWFEDVDFLKRAHDHGQRAIYVPSAVARHTGAHSVDKLPHQERVSYWYASLFRYAAKHFRSPERRMVCAAMLAGSLLRMVAELVLKRELDPLRVYGGVIRLACLGLIPQRGRSKVNSGVLARRRA